MTHVRLKNVNVSIPIYDSHALRLIRLPSFSNVGSAPTRQAVPTA